MRGTSASRRSRRRIFFKRHLESSGHRPWLRRRARCRRPSRRSREPFVDGPVRVGNRFCVLPMEGWDGTPDGEPSELTRRRWQRFGASGAKLIWGGEAVAVRHDGRANPNQLLMSAAHRARARRRSGTSSSPRTASDSARTPTAICISASSSRTRAASRARTSGTVRSRSPRTLNPILDKRFPGGVAADDRRRPRSPRRRLRRRRAPRLRHRVSVRRRQALPRLPRPRAAERARPRRPLRRQPREPHALPASPSSTASARRSRASASACGSRSSTACRTARPPTGRANPRLPPPAIATASACSTTRGLDRALDDGREFLAAAASRAACAGSASPPAAPTTTRTSSGRRSFRRPTATSRPRIRCAASRGRFASTATLKAEFPDMVFVGSAYTYLQEWLPHVGQYTRSPRADGLRRPRPHGAVVSRSAGRRARRASRSRASCVCRTFSDCTTGPRIGLVSGCYPLDPFYVAHPDAPLLKEAKAPARDACTIERTPVERPRAPDHRGPRRPSSRCSRSSASRCTACRSSIRLRAGARLDAGSR